MSNVVKASEFTAVVAMPIAVLVTVLVLQLVAIRRRMYIPRDLLVGTTWLWLAFSTGPVLAILAKASAGAMEWWIPYGIIFVLLLANVLAEAELYFRTR